MKKIFLVIICLLLPFVSAFGSESKEFSVIWSLVDSLHSLDWGSSYELTESDEVSQMMTKLMNQNSKYEFAATCMQKYINDKDEYISTVSTGIVGGVLGLVDANNKVIDKLRKMTNFEKEGFTDVEYTIAETNAQKKKSWEMITLAAGWSMPLIMEFAKNENPSGKIPFKLSEKERQLLVKRVDELFAEKLKRYKSFLKLSKQGKETDPNDSTYIIAGVERIKEYLTTETYEEAKAREEASK